MDVISNSLCGLLAVRLIGESDEVSRGRGERRAFTSRYRDRESSGKNVESNDEDAKQE